MSSKAIYGKLAFAIHRVEEVSDNRSENKWRQIRKPRQHRVQGDGRRQCVDIEKQGMRLLGVAAESPSKSVLCYTTT